MRDDLFKRLGLGKLSDESKSALSEDMGEAAMARIAARLEAMMTPEQMSAFEDKLKTDEAAAFDLLKEYVPGYQSIAREEIDAVRDEIISAHDAVMKKLDDLKD